MRVVVDAARDQAAVASRVRGKGPVDLEGRPRAGGEQERVALAPLVQAMELPHPEPEADGRDQERDHQADPIAPVYPQFWPQFGPHFGLIAHPARSEEHTSELQSPCNLVCRLLLEKKKNRTKNITVYASYINIASLRD